MKKRVRRGHRKTKKSVIVGGGEGSNSFGNILDNGDESLIQLFDGNTDISKIVLYKSITMKNNVVVMEDKVEALTVLFFIYNY
jgi:hypothetical protein